MQKQNQDKQTRYAKTQFSGEISYAGKGRRFEKNRMTIGKWMDPVKVVIGVPL